MIRRAGAPEQTLRGSVDALVGTLALANPAAFGRSRRVKRSAVRLATAAKLPNCWKIDVAAMLANIGAVMLPQGDAERLTGAPLSAEEQEMVDRAPGHLNPDRHIPGSRGSSRSSTCTARRSTW